MNKFYVIKNNYDSDTIIGITTKKSKAEEILEYEEQLYYSEHDDISKLDLSVPDWTVTVLSNGKMTVEKTKLISIIEETPTENHWVNTYDSFHKYRLIAKTEEEALLLGKKKHEEYLNFKELTL